MPPKQKARKRDPFGGFFEKARRCFIEKGKAKRPTGRLPASGAVRGACVRFFFSRVRICRCAPCPFCAVCIQNAAERVQKTGLLKGFDILAQMCYTVWEKAVACRV